MHALLSHKIEVLHQLSTTGFAMHALLPNIQYNDTKKIHNRILYSNILRKIVIRVAEYNIDIAIRNLKLLKMV